MPYTVGDCIILMPEILINILRNRIRVCMYTCVRNIYRLQILRFANIIICGVYLCYIYIYNQFWEEYFQMFTVCRVVQRYCVIVAVSNERRITWCGMCRTKTGDVYAKTRAY